MNVKLISAGIYVSGIWLVVSTISGISSIYTDSQGIHIGHYPNDLFRIPVLAIALGFFYTAFCIQKGRLLGWRLYFLFQVFAWAAFIVMGTHAVSEQYPKDSWQDDLLFAGMLALVSTPVFGYWGWRWYKKKKNFN